MTELEREFKNILTARREKSRLRGLDVASHTLIDFSSNDYISLSTNATFKSMILTELENLPIGSGGSRLLDGNNKYAEDLELTISSFHKSESALLFSSGFDANVSIFTSIPQPNDYIFYDEYIHASVHDGMKLCRTKHRYPFKHNNVESLASQLQKFYKGTGNIFIALESVYSMDGDLAPLKEIVELSQRVFPTKIYIIVDEAHATGVVGDGRGLVAQLGLEDEIFIRVHTFGKALSSNGAAVLCSPLTREYLINYSRPLIFSTAMSFVMLSTIKCAYQFLLTDEFYGSHNRLMSLINFFDRESRLSGLNKKFQLIGGHSSIFALLTPSPRKLSRELRNRGFLVRPIVFPTVPKGAERIRICLHALNTEEQLQNLIKYLLEFNSVNL